jgi:hypothetical protein
MSIPRTEPALAIWLKNFGQAFAVHGPTLGFTAAEVAAVEADVAMLQYVISDLVPNFKSGLEARYSYKELIKNGPVGAPTSAPPPLPATGAAPATVAPGVMPRLRLIIQHIKSAPAYTTEIGDDLGITGKGEGDEVDTDTAKPKLKATALTGHVVRVEFNKSIFDGVWIESKRKGDADWMPLGIDLHSPYIDTRPPAQAGTPEAREYRARFYDNDMPTGAWSDSVSVTTIP